MNDQGVVRIPMSDVMNRLEVNIQVTGVRLWTWRMQLGTRIIALAARVMGCNINVELGSEDGQA